MIEYLKTRVKTETEDIAAYRMLVQKEYTDITDKEEIFRKAHFLSSFAADIPVIVDEQELLIGSMRFWRAGGAGRNMGHIIVDYRMILREGICGIREKISRLNTKEAKAFAEAVEAFRLFIERYTQKAETLQMKEAAENCRYLLAHAPESFAQALQLVWFVHLFLHAEGKAAAVSFGRFDDYLYPFYKRDIDAGILTREKAKELLKCFWLKTCEGDESQNLTVGGNIENDLTYLCLEVTSELKVQQPSISVRISENSSEELWKRTLELIKCKIGMPAIFNDRTIIRSLINAKVEPEDAVNYAIVGCYEANSDGNTFGTTANAGCMHLHEVLLGFLNQEETYEDYESFYRAFRNYFKETYQNVILPGFQKNWERIRQNCISPFQSACMGGCLENGIPAELGGCKYTMAGINILGIGTLVDSLYVMKKLVFESREYTYGDFVDQVKNNFPDRTLSGKCKALAGKYGTDQPETNELAAELSVFIADLIDQGMIYEGVVPYAGLFAFLQDVHSGHYPATPDGRLKGERISYGVGASDFCTMKTVTSVMNSASHIANDRFADGNPLMFNIPEKDVAGEKGDLLLKSLITSYFKQGGFHVQFNVTDADILKQAKEKPEEYRDLIVRISGYSEYFTRLDEVIQTALIERA